MLNVWKMLVVVILGFLPTPLVGQSPQFRGAPDLTGEVFTTGVERFGGIAWRFETGNTVRSSPALVDGVIYIGSSDGFLYALDALSGDLVWKYDAESPIASSPAIHGETVVVGSRNGVLHGVSTNGGISRWSLETGPDLPTAWGYEGWDYIMSSPTVVDGVAYWGSGDGYVYAVTVESGEELWRFSTGGRVRSTPAVVNGQLVVGNSSGFVFALDAASGRERWRFETAGANLNSADFGFDRRQIFSSPAINDGKVYIGSRDASLYALDATDGSKIWNYDGDGSSWIIASPAIAANRVFSGRSTSGIFRAIDRETGTELWQVSAGGYVYSSPVVVGSTVYVGQGDGDFVAVDVATGEERWGYRTGAAIFSTPLVNDGRIYFGSDDGFVYSIKAAENLPFERAVFYDESRMNLSTFGSVERHQVVRDYFVNRGYELLETSNLEGFLNDRISDSAPSVVVFAMDYLPPTVGTAETGEPLLRRYLEAGGKVVWMGYPPGFIVRNEETGEFVSMNREAPTALLGVDFDAYLGDSHGIIPTAIGHHWGLVNRRIGSGSTLPSEVSEVLAIDALGRAAAWVQNYGGKSGSGFVFLQPTVSLTELAEVQRVAEYFAPISQSMRN